MTLAELLRAIPEQFPEVQLDTKYGAYPTGQYQIHLENGWIISLSTGSLSGSDRKLSKTHSLDETIFVEVAIFDHNQNWFLVEGMTVVEGGKTGVYAWLPCEKVLSIIRYISTFSGKET